MTTLILDTETKKQRNKETKKQRNKETKKYLNKVFSIKHKNLVTSLLTNDKQLAIIKKHRGFKATSSAMKNKDW